MGLINDIKSIFKKYNKQEDKFTPLVSDSKGEETPDVADIEELQYEEE